jgi:hypothetical protein
MPDLPSVCKVNDKKSQTRPAKRRNIPLSPAAPIEAHMAVRRPASGRLDRALRKAFCNEIPEAGVLEF